MIPRRFHALFLLVLLVLNTLFAGSPARAQISGPGSTVPWNGMNWFLYGADYPWYNYGTDFGTGGWGKFTDWTIISSDLAHLHGQGAHLLRWWVFADGRYSPEFNGNGTISGLDSSFFADIDQALKTADTNNTYLLLTLMDFYMWANATYSGTVQMGGHAAIVTDATVQQSYLDNALKPLLQHVAASPYRNRVLGYDIINEPEGEMADFWQGDASLATSTVQTFVQNCASYIHTYGNGAYATVGSASAAYVSTWTNLGLDFYQVHYYPWMDNNVLGSGLPPYSSLNLDRPCLLGEFATVDSDYTIGSTAAYSARWYLDAAYNKGYAGALAWSYGAGDSSTDWTDFQPVFTNWAQAHPGIVGPQQLTLTSLSPTSANAGSKAITLVVKGSGLLPNATVDWNGSPLTTTFVSSSQLKAAVPAALLANPGTIQITVSPQGGGSTNAKPFTILVTTLKLTSASLTRNSATGAYTANVTLKNTGSLTAPNVRVTASTLGAAATNTPLPLGLGSLAAGSALTTSLTYPGSAGASGTVVTLKVSGTFTGGTFTGSLKVTLP